MSNNILHTKNSKSLLAKLMAEENITIQHKKVNTASFDMVRRILTVPIWKEMSNDMYDLFMGHEVGHALYTPCEPEVLEEAVSRSCMPFINVTEDARIERSVKRRFPGLKGPFFRAYKELMDEDFFGIGKKNLADMAFIDRLNIYFKTAMNDFEAAQLFSDEEMPFVDRMATTETFAEVADLSEDIYNFVSEKKTDDEQSENMVDQLQGMPQEFNDESGDSDDQPTDSRHALISENDKTRNKLAGVPILVQDCDSVIALRPPTRGRENSLAVATVLASVAS